MIRPADAYRRLRPEAFVMCARLKTSLNAFGRIGAIVLLAAATSAPLCAGDVESWNEVNFQFWNKGRVALRARGVLRWRDHLGDFYDRRAGTEVRLTVTRRITLSGVYLLRDVEYAKGLYDVSHRLGAGLNYRLLNRRSGGLAGATNYERDFNLIGKPGLNRLKQSVEFEVPRWRVSPWIFEEAAFQSLLGFARNRVRAGIAWRFSEHHGTLRVAYQNQQLEGSAGWRNSHAIFTQLSLVR